MGVRMLRLLRVRNFAIIDSLELEFHPGLNVITGETGAGKSIVLEALGLILGNRAETDLIRSGCAEATVEAVFDPAAHAATSAKLEKQGIDLGANNHELLIRRIIQRNGKNKIYLNGELIALSQLADLCENLVDLCSQHENQSLAKPSFQLELLDRYGGLEGETSKIREAHSAWRSLENERQMLEKNVSSNSDEDFIRFQIREIEEFGLKEGEDEALQAEHRRLRGASSLMEWGQSALQILRDGFSDQPGMTVLDGLAKAKQKLLRMLEQDPALAPHLALLDQMAEEARELCVKMGSYVGSIDSSPDRLQEIEERLTKLNRLKRKYGNSLGEISLRKEALEEKLSEASSTQERLQALRQRLAGVVLEYEKMASLLSRKRASVARLLVETVSGELKELRMAESAFEVELAKLPLEPLAGADGMDRAQFLFSANVGEEKKALGKVASGGELSRLMLVLRRTLGDRGGIGVYVFDEIDAGMGGQTGALVGKKLKEVAEHNQVICITHLPQVAAFANAHYVVRKDVIGARTVSTVTALRNKERVEELARMLGGARTSDKSRAHARELLKGSSP